MAYMDKRQIQQAFKDGLLEEVKAELVRYGTIHKTKDWDVENCPVYNGAHRAYWIAHHDIQWIVRMHNGRVAGVSRTQGDHKFF